MQQKVQKKAFCFWDNSTWLSIVQFSLLRTGYFSSVANVLTSRPKIFHVNKRDFFQLNWVDSGQWISWRRRTCDAYFNSAWARLPCSLSKGPLKWDLLDIYLTTFSGSVISEVQKLRVSYHLFFQNIQNLISIQKTEKKIHKRFFVFEIIASELVSLNFLF